MQCSALLETRPSAVHFFFSDSHCDKNNACVCTLGSDIESIIAPHSRVAEPSLPQGIHTQRPRAQRQRTTAQVTKGTNRNSLAHGPFQSQQLRLCSSANLVFLSWRPCSPWHDYGLSYSSLQQKQRRIQKRSCKLPPTGTSQSSSLVRTSRMDLRTLSVMLLCEQRSNET